MSSEATEAPQGAGSLADRITKPDDAKPTGTTRIARPPTRRVPRGRDNDDAAIDS
jgi:hypothetical protein